MKRFNPNYDPRALSKYLIWLCVCAALMKATGGAIAALLPLVALMMLFQNKPFGLFFVLLSMVTATVGNGFFFPKNFIFALSIRGTLFVLAFLVMMRVAGRKKSPLLTPFLGIIPYILWECASSLQGWEPIISYLKILLFLAIYFAYYAIANEVVGAKRIDVRQLRAMILSIVIFFVIGSFVLIPFPGISQMNASEFKDPQQALSTLSLFKGMTMHSQSLGPIVAAFATLIFGDLVFSIKKWDPLYVVMLLISPVLIYKTSSRTAMGTYLAGFMMVMWFAMKARGLGARWRGKVVSTMWLTILVAMAALLAVPSVQKGVMQYVLKFGAADANADLSMGEIVSTRQGLMDEALDNFQKKPLFGNGFQVSEELVNKTKGSVASYLSAPIEKGVWVTAVLEEGGVPGFILFAGFIFVTIFTLARRHAYIAASLMVVITVSNLGEFTFFSMSYTGGMIWMLVFSGAVLDAQRLKQQKVSFVGRPW